MAPLAGRYRDDANPAIRESAVGALAESGAESATGWLIEAAESDQVLQVRLRALEGLAKRSATASRRTLRDLALQAKDATIRRAAVQAIAESGRLSTEDRHALDSVSCLDRDQRLRQAAASLLAK